MSIGWHVMWTPSSNFFWLLEIKLSTECWDRSLDPLKFGIQFHDFNCFGLGVVLWQTSRTMDLENLPSLKLTANAPEKMSIISQPVFYYFSGARMLALIRECDIRACRTHHECIYAKRYTKDVLCLVFGKNPVKPQHLCLCQCFCNQDLEFATPRKFVTYASFHQVQFFAASTICRIASAQVRKLGKQNKDATWEGVG